jgi:hypothetical protein
MEWYEESGSEILGTDTIPTKYVVSLSYSKKMWKIWKKGKSNSDKIWTIWKKSKLNSEMIWKLSKKKKLNSEKWKICRTDGMEWYEESGSEILGTDTIPTKYVVSLSLSQWKVLCSATQVVDDLISRAKEGEPLTVLVLFPFVKTQGHSYLRRMQCPFSIRDEVLPDVNCQLRGFDDEVDVFS